MFGKYLSKNSSSTTESRLPISRTATDDWFVEPWIGFSDKAGAIKLHANVGVYVPVTGGPVMIYTTGSSATTRVAKNFEAGIELSFWKVEGQPCPVRFGPVAKISLGNTSVKLRYLCFGGDADNQLRVQATFPL